MSARPKILSAITTRQGTTLILYRKEATYYVGVLSSHRRPIPLAQAQFWTYASACERLEAEARARSEMSP